MKHFQIVMFDSPVGNTYPLEEKLGMRARVTTYASVVGFDDFGEKLLDGGDESVAC